MRINDRTFCKSEKTKRKGKKMRKQNNTPNITRTFLVSFNWAHIRNTMCGCVCVCFLSVNFPTLKLLYCCTQNWKKKTWNEAKLTQDQCRVHWRYEIIGNFFFRHTFECQVDFMVFFQHTITWMNMFFVLFNEANFMAGPISSGWFSSSLNHPIGVDVLANLR